MIKSFLISVFLLIPLLGFSQLNDSLAEPIIPMDKESFLKDIDFTFDMRMSFRAYKFRGGDQYYNGMQFQNGFTALGISGKLHEKVNFRFRHRFNKGGDVQSLDQLGNNIEIAYIDIKASPLLNIRLGKMNPFYGGYEYEFSPMYVLEYNDIYSNALAFVTGAGITYQAFENHVFGLQVLNSRTMLYEDLYGDVIAENIQEPIWPVSIVGNWRGNFFDGKLETIYSLSYGNEVKNRGTYFFTLGHKYQNHNLTIMYDFHYSYEQVDTKGIMTNLLADGTLAENVMYIENWLRAEYRFSPKFKGLLTLMTSSGYDDVNLQNDHLRTSYGMIPTLYYSPFKNIDIRFFLAYLGRYYDYSSYARETLGASNYNRNELRVGVIAPLLLL
ncbi:OprO/OprP family phosphate-selective porin [Salegentibacter sp. JZCK2]|uniref:porin n=1 Tax=Salegentibacter tibetensis TaxID=2873600 RepID=UPI001CCB3D44|nr:porin [Salegentibacter tibetensis]MBZ9730045.1 OprO/OprP family phosphate-selective porin [Salegentibacter tibetensis]